MITDLSSLSPGRFALYGFGAVGKFVFDALIRERPDVVITTIIDDGKAGTTQGALRICTVEDAAGRRDEFEQVLVAGFAWRAMVRRLEGLGITDYVPIDLLVGPSDSAEMTVGQPGQSIRLSTPNRLSTIVAERFFDIEPETINWIDGIPPGSCLYDIGASNGHFALYGAIVRGISVVAFEPDAMNFCLLSNNRIINQDRFPQPFIVLPIALSNGPGLVELVSADVPYAGAHGKVMQSARREGLDQRDRTYRQLCIADALSAIIERYELPPPDYLKIDVDGAEFEVLEGSSPLLATGIVRQILIEVEDAAVEALTTIMRKNRYELAAVHTINEMIGGAVVGVSNYLFSREA